MSGSTPRFEREFEGADRRYRASVAWRGETTGYGVLYFYPLDASADDRLDRRVLLTPETQTDTLDESRLRELCEAGRPLTETERRFTAPDGRQWLAQSRGPVWAGRVAAEGGFTVLFRSLEGRPGSRSAAAGHVGELADEELAENWASAAEQGAVRREIPKRNRSETATGEAGDPP